MNILFKIFESWGHGVQLMSTLFSTLDLQPFALLHQNIILEQNLTRMKDSG